MFLQLLGGFLKREHGNDIDSFV